MNKLTVVAFTACALALLALAGCKQHAAAPPETPVADAPPAVTEAPAADSASADAGAAAGDEAAVDQSIDNVLGDHAAYRRFIADFQKVVAAGDGAAVASMVSYPISVQIDGKPTQVKDAAEFTRSYDKFMTPDIAKAITETRYADVMVNDKGVMLGNG